MSVPLFPKEAAMLRYFDMQTVYVLAGGLTVVILGLIFRHFESTRRAMPIWLSSGLVGAFVGGGAALATMHGVGYHWAKPTETAGGGRAESAGGGAGAMPGMGGPPSGMMGGMGGGMMGGGGGGMGGGGGGAASRSRRDLTTLVGKLDLLTRGVAIDLTDEQASQIAEAISDLDKEDEMTEDQATERVDGLKQILTSDNQSALDSIELPRRGGRGAGGGGPGGGGPGGGGGMMGMMGAGMGTGGPMAMGGPGQQPSNENPFKQEDNAKRLQSLLARLRPSEPKAETK
jgi:hypothetical protein